MATPHPAGEAAAEHVVLYPPPPPHYRLFGPGAPHPPPTPPPIIEDGEYEVFGELCSTDVAMPALQGRPLFAGRPGDSALDFRAALTAILHELLFAYVELTDALARRPAAGWARAAEAVGAAARNAAHLLNALRPAQAQSTGAALLRADAARTEGVAAEIEAAVAAFDAALEKGREELVTAAGGEGAR